MSTRYSDVLIRLKEERCRLSLLQNDMARYIHINQSNYSKVEQGLRRLSYNDLTCLCETAIDMHYVFTGQRGNSYYLEQLKECSYSEAICYLNMIHSFIVLDGKKDSDSELKDLYERARYIPLIEENQHSTNIWRVLRYYMNWQQQKMADKLGIDVKKLRGLENGRNMPDAELLCRIYDVFGIPPALILKDRKGVLSEITILLGMFDKESEGRAYKLFNLIRKL